MLKNNDVEEAVQQVRLYLLEELRALGFDSKIRLNEFNDNDELLYLVESVRDFVFEDPEVEKETASLNYWS
jgi:hypothetical protein